MKKIKIIHFDGVGHQSTILSTYLFLVLGISQTRPGAGHFGGRHSAFFAAFACCQTGFPNSLPYLTGPWVHFFLLMPKNELVYVFSPTGFVFHRPWIKEY